jgi:hypothetical protein
MRYLSDACLENNPIFEERAHRHNSRGNNGHRGSMNDVSSTLHQSDIPCSKRGDIIQRKIKVIQVGGATLRGEWPFAIDVKGGDMVTLM